MYEHVPQYVLEYACESVRVVEGDDRLSYMRPHGFQWPSTHPNSLLLKYHDTLLVESGKQHVSSVKCLRFLCVCVCVCVNHHDHFPRTDTFLSLRLHRIHGHTHP